MVKKIVLALVVVAAAVSIAGGFYFGGYLLKVQRVPADPNMGFHAPYYLYVSPGARDMAAEDKVVTLLVQPNNSGTNSDDPEVHDSDAKWTGFERHKIADELNVVLLVPAFIRPAKDWHIYTHALDRDVLTTTRKDLARLDLQLIAMIDHARRQLETEGIKTNEKFLLQGFSASGMFANRFTVLHPDRVMAVASGSPGGWAIAPLAAFNGKLLPYPAGTADVEALTDMKFDSAAYASVPQLIVMGADDNNDSLDKTDGWEEETSKLINYLFGKTPLARWESSKRLYGQAGANAQFVLVPGVGHDRKTLQKYSTEFFVKILSQSQN
jgi:pimeloyl-ACP methyl ester carboxylesterase